MAEEGRNFLGYTEAKCRLLCVCGHENGEHLADDPSPCDWWNKQLGEAFRKCECPDFQPAEGGGDAAG